MPPNLGGFFMVRSYYPSECHADYFDFERIEALKPAIEACGISTLSQSPMLGFHKQMDNRIKLLEEILSFRMQGVEFDNGDMYVDGHKAASDVQIGERFSRNAETDLVCRLLLEKKNGTGSVGTKARRWRRAAFAGRFEAGQEGSTEKNAQGRSQPIQALSPAHGSIMDPLPVALDQNSSGAAGDFPALLRRKGLLGPAAISPIPLAGTQKTWQPTEATTILAFKFSGGVLVAGDRRATAGNTVVYDRADKVLEI